MTWIPWLQATVIALGLGLGALLQGVGHPGPATAVLALATAVALVPLALGVAARLSRREPGVDLIALFALTGALWLGEYLAGAIVALMLATGQLLEAQAMARARRELRGLLARAPRVAHRFERGELHTIDVGEVAPGDELLVKEADVVPVDGLVAQGLAVLDESALTGEARPVEHPAGSPVESGTLNAGGAFRLRATARAADSTYAGIVRLVDAAQRSKAPLSRLADRYALAFVPIVLVVAGVAAALSGQLVRGLAVLVVATPCPLLLAVPIAIFGGVSRLARRGVIVKGGAALERLGRCRSLFLDKTGTVTSGAPCLVRVATHAVMEPAMLLRLAASADQVSSHVLAGALLRAARDQRLVLSFPEAAREEPGLGVEARVEDQQVRVGRFEWVLAGAAPDEAAAALRQRTLRTLGSAVFVALDGVLAGALVFEDPIRVEIPRTLRALRRAGVRQITMLTGDHSTVARSVGAALGFDRVLAAQTPAEKATAVQQARQHELTVMVGDGINDAPALAAADVGVAMGGRGASIASESADVVLTTDRFDRIAEAIQIAQRTRQIALESVWLGMALSLFAMGLAAAGALPPATGALLQEGIDVLAIASSLRALLPPRRGPRDRARELLGPALASRLRTEHATLGPALERLRNLADEMDTLDRGQLRAALVALHDFLSGELLEHERLDEAEIYPAIADRLQGDDPLAALSRTHQEIFQLGRTLELLVADLPQTGPDPAELPDIRRLLYGLHAVLRLHFAQEEELYQSVSEQYLAA